MTYTIFTTDIDAEILKKCVDIMEPAFRTHTTRDAILTYEEHDRVRLGALLDIIEHALQSAKRS
jgi:hypothetical protein